MEFGLAFNSVQVAAMGLQLVCIEWQFWTVKPEYQVVETISDVRDLRLKSNAGWCFHVGFFLLVQRQISRYR